MAAPWLTRGLCDNDIGETTSSGEWTLAGVYRELMRNTGGSGGAEGRARRRLPVAEESPSREGVISYRTIAALAHLHIFNFVRASLAGSPALRGR